MGAKRKQNENLKKKSSYQDTLDSDFIFDKYVTATDTDYEDQQTLLMWKLILQKGYFSVNIQNDYVKHKSEIDVMGMGYKPIGAISDGLKDYMFHIAMENQQRDFYFTEKLINFASHIR